MSTMLKFDHLVLNEDHIVMLHLNGQTERFTPTGEKVMLTYVDITLSTGKHLTFSGDQAEAIRRFYKHTTDVLDLGQQMLRSENR